MKRMFDVLAAFTVVSAVGLQVAAAQAPKPGPEHARLGYFVGKWKAEGEMKPGPRDLREVRPAGFEPATHSLEGCCSIQLSYGRPTTSKYNGHGTCQPHPA
jgi:hypothetical protein